MIGYLCAPVIYQHSPNPNGSGFNHTRLTPGRKYMRPLRKANLCRPRSSLLEGAGARHGWARLWRTTYGQPWTEASHSFRVTAPAPCEQWPVSSEVTEAPAPSHSRRGLVTHGGSLPQAFLWVRAGVRDATWNRGCCCCFHCGIHAQSRWEGERRGRGSAWKVPTGFTVQPAPHPQLTSLPRLYVPLSPAVIARTHAQGPGFAGSPPGAPCCSPLQGPARFAGSSQYPSQTHFFSGAPRVRLRPRRVHGSAQALTAQAHRMAIPVIRPN